MALCLVPDYELLLDIASSLRTLFDLHDDHLKKGRGDSLRVLSILE